MARKGLGKGLDSLIPDFYNEDFDSNSPRSLEDMLKESDDTEEIVDDIETKQDTKEEIEADKDDKGDNPPSEGSEEVKEKVSEEKTEEKTHEGDEPSEDLSSVEVSESTLQTSQEIKIQKEHVEEVKKIVNKNPRITLWSSKSSAVFRYLRKTEPEFSISKEASLLIEEAVAKKYPEIWALFEED